MKVSRRRERERERPRKKLPLLCLGFHRGAILAVTAVH